MHRVQFKRVGFRNYYIVLDGKTIGHMYGGSIPFVTVDVDGKIIPVARFKHSTGRLQQAKSFCQVVFTAMSVEDVVTILYDRRMMKPIELKTAILEGRIPKV